MSRWRRSLFGNRGLGINLIASFSFLLLAVYGWGLSWQEVGQYLLMLVLLMVCILIPAFLLAWVLRKLRSSSKQSDE